MTVRTKIFAAVALSAALALTGCSSNSDKETELHNPSQFRINGSRPRRKE